MHCGELTVAQRPFLSLLYLVHAVEINLVSISKAEVIRCQQVTSAVIIEVKKPPYTLKKKNKTNQNPIPLYSKYISKHFEEKGFTSCERQSVMAESLSVYDEENSCKHFIYK